MKLKFKGFTLAEVLITLGVIGVVAAITLPALISSYNKKITETRLAKFYSVFNQAIKLSVAENGDVDTWDGYWQALDSNNQIEVKDGFDTYLRPYMQISYTKKIRHRGTDKVLYVLPDGSAFAYGVWYIRDITFFPKDAEKCITKNNPLGTCSFMFVFYPLEDREAWKYHYNRGIEAYLFDWDGNEEHLKSGSQYSCTTRGDYCTALIKNNGWKIPKDYPLKLQY